MQISICEHHINRMKDKNYMIIWVEKEKNYIWKNLASFHDKLSTN